MHFEIIKKRKIWYAISGFFFITAVIALSVWGLKLGIDFTGGTLIEISFTQERPSIQVVQEELNNSDLNLGAVMVQPAGDSDMILRLRDMTEDEHQAMLTLLKNSHDLTENRFETIGSSIGQELAGKAVSALIMSMIFIILYIAYAFRKVSQPVASWKFGVTAIIALVHDVIIIIGVFAFLGHFMNVEVGTMFVTALLTILGFSVHDTIVVFDRTRENLFSYRNREEFSEIVNDSVNQTIWRSVNTSFSTLLVLTTIYFFGGEVIKYFTLALMLGIFVGTYSSIFLASPIIVDWYQMGLNKNNK